MFQVRSWPSRVHLSPRSKGVAQTRLSMISKPPLSSAKCMNCGMTACASVLCNQHLAKKAGEAKAPGIAKKAIAKKSAPASMKAIAKKPAPATEKAVAKKPAAGKPAASKPMTKGSNKETNKKDAAFEEEAGPILGPALLKLLRDPSKPPFNHAFRENGEWVVPTGGVANYPLCKPDANESTLKAKFSMHDLYRLQFDGEWKLKISKKLKRFVPLHSHGTYSCSREHLLVGLTNFTTYTVDNGKQTDYETEEFHLLVLHERANLCANEWEEDGAFAKCYF
jgi:hypothetical protein